MHIEYTLTFIARDHDHAARLQNRRLGWGCLILMFAFFFWLALRDTESEQTPSSVSESFLLSATISLFLWGMCWVMSRGFLWLQSRSLARYQRKYDCRVEVILDEEGVTQTNSVWTTWDGWSTYTGYCEDRHLFLVAHRSGAAYIIPKRVLTPEQIEEVRDGLQRKFA